MTTALQTIQPSEYDIIRDQAQALVKTGFLPPAIKTPEQALAIILTGRELGIPAMAALNTINVIQGKPTVSPQLMIALIERSGQLDDVSYDVNPDRAIVTMKRKGRTPHTEIFSMADANRMQTTEWVNNQKRSIPLSEKFNWKSMPETMLKWRAVAACARVVFPDVILGLYTPEEMGADVSISDDGEMTVQATPKPETDIKAGIIKRIGQIMRAHNEEIGDKVWTKESIFEFIQGNYGVAQITDLDEENLIDFELRLRTIIEEDIASREEDGI